MHEHKHSLYLKCFECNMWGVPLPEGHFDGAKCGNCGSEDTAAYYPTCCLDNLDQDIDDALNEKIKKLGW